MKKIISLFLAAVMLLSTASFAVSASASGTATGAEIVAMARSKVGCSYVSGASGPDSFDCSGLTMWVFAQFGISLPHSSEMIYNNPGNYGVKVGTNSVEDALPGDLICWYGHIGIYTGNYNYNGSLRGFLVDAANPSKGVVEQPIWAANGNYIVVRVNGVSTYPQQKGNMTVPQMTFDQSSYRVGNTFVFSWNKTSADTDFRYYKIIITNELLRQTLTVTTDEKDVNDNSYVYRILSPGTYTITVYAVPYNKETTRQRSATRTWQVGQQITSLDSYAYESTRTETDEDGNPITVTDTKYRLDGWAYINRGRIYYFKNNEYLTGWQWIGVRWYYFNEDGTEFKGWLHDENGDWYYLNQDGSMARYWLKFNGGWYYLNAGGVMQTGWVEVSNKWYYLDENGKMLTGWVKVNKHWYYMNSSGAMLTGWVKLDGKWYNLRPTGAMRTGWYEESDDIWYYFLPSGVMVDDTRKINGKWYYFNKQGICQNP